MWPRHKADISLTRGPKMARAESVSVSVEMPALVRHINDDVMTWKRFPHYWPFVRAIHEFPHKAPVVWSCDFFFVEQTLELPVIWDTLIANFAWAGHQLPKSVAPNWMNWRPIKMATITMNGDKWGYEYDLGQKYDSRESLWWLS